MIYRPVRERSVDDIMQCAEQGIENSGFDELALLSLSSASFLPTLVGGWLLGIMDLQTIRLWHHLMMYAIVAFFFVHIYISWWLDTVEKNGLMGSIFGGYKFVTGKEWE